MSRQFVDDMFLGIPSLVFGDTWQYIQDEEYQEGREIGRCASIVVGSALALDGAKNIGIGVAALLPTLGGGVVCTAASGGLCAILTGLGLTAEAALIGIGLAEVGWGLGVVRYAAHNPISGGSSGSGSGRVKLHADAQGKHIPGHKNYDPARGRSILTHSDPQALLDSHAGTGNPLRGTPGKPGYKEWVNFGEEIGIYIDQSTGVATPTTNGIIHYSSRGAHIVPARP
jgi:hypothetical protein